MVYGYRMIVNGLAVHPRDCVADWELWLPTHAQYCEGGSHCVLLAQEKLIIQN